ncbi:MAG TPA: hypothetical protein VMJ93_14640 [Verrucomicrobiae bacterium]|nr:hypothetical protein [Verrucomicrobiae bacterium]
MTPLDVVIVVLAAAVATAISMVIAETQRRRKLQGKPWTGAEWRARNRKARYIRLSAEARARKLAERKEGKDLN